jgi:hypothetical protein
LSNISPEESKKLMLLFNRIPEHFVKTLESFPFIFFTDVSDARLEYNVDVHLQENSSISYAINIAKENNSLVKRCRGLEVAVRDLFWKEMKIKIAINNEEVYQSE